MPTEVFTTYTEVDPNSRITPTSSKVTWDSLTQNEDAYVYDDKGAAYFSGNFRIDFTVHHTAGTQQRKLYVCNLANIVDDAYGIAAASGDMLGVSLGTGSGGDIRLILEERDGGTLHIDSPYAISADTDYYLSFVRDETIGTYGTLYLYIYSDYLRTTLLNTQTITLSSSKKDFQYLYACQTFNSGDAATMSGYIEALEIVYNIATPIVTTQACTDITGTTATGHGTIENLGSSSVTAHGHCWIIDDGVPTEPTTSDSKTDNGAGSLGSFTSSITTLIQGTPYRVRAYAVNSEGTFYGGTVTFIAGQQSSQLEPNQIAVGNTTLLYTGKNGKRYYLQGVEF